MLSLLSFGAIGQESYIGLVSGNHAGPYLHLLTLDSSGTFDLTIHYPTACGQISKPSRVDGNWQKTDNLILFTPNQLLNKTSRIVNTISHKSLIEQQTISLKFIHEFKRGIPQLQIKLFYKDSNDFIVLYTDENGEIQIPVNTFDSIFLLGLFWYTEENLNFSLQNEGGSLQFNLLLSNLKFSRLIWPTTVIGIIQKDDSIKFEGILEKLNFKRGVRSVHWVPHISG